MSGDSRPSSATTAGPTAEPPARDESSGPRRGARTALDLQRAKLAKLMQDPAKPAFIPEVRKVKDPNKAAEFVYNVMGSSAGAGSGEFHVYRQIRRKESLRQAVIQGQKQSEDLNRAYHEQLRANELAAEARTAKKRQKRLKKKKNAKRGKPALPTPASDDSSSSQSESETHPDSPAQTPSPAKPAA
ncbi:hypothetical protein TCAL_05617 [Tigriopus californicus]|uniref:Uncharacterized protein n=1 Tax=Tigriopus californicus TaxID=6832 RepID=A0A553NUS0_TIGCA|nr:PRKR-interacting protein 1 homolog [Tigriopus californicus]TRY69181.1 hypothetical protein TCAL_05617 [Tigriopus californicus]|eukprot:TCALIF_05617-PA protein Name:"Similar to prkrip1 PRKR-interacting protein 1 homolog (Xenopus laevis)" AED:0.37 eAED:0.37 QI:0/-1/0/1/-1/1/1/0/186